MLSISLTVLAAVVIQTSDPAPVAESPPTVITLDSSSPPPVVVRPTGPLRWEDLPDSLKASIEAIEGKPPAQAVLTIGAAAIPDVDFRTVDHGAVLSEQGVRPAAFATIVRPARNARKYGPAGAVMWAAVNADGDWWCWRNGDRYPNWFIPSDIYCYRDADGDGDFDVTMENPSPESTRRQSRFQFTTMGHDERLSDVVTYTLGGQADFSEKVVIRYDGPGAAKLGPDGRLIDGVVIFHLLTGPGIARPIPTGNLLVQPAQTQPDDGLDLVSPIAVVLDSEGRGRAEDPRGVVIEVDRVNLDGTARVRLVSGLPEGRTLLLPAITRKDMLEMFSQMLGRPTE